jgi:hypothetical protein
MYGGSALKKYLKQFFKRSENTYITATKKTGGSEPVLFYYKYGRDHAVPIPKMKEGVSPMDLLKPFVYDLSPEAYLFCSEAYLRTFTKCKDRDVEKMGWNDLGEQIAKQEVIAMVGATMNGDKYRVMYNVKRKRGQVSKLERQGKRLDVFFTSKEP